MSIAIIDRLQGERSEQVRFIEELTTVEGRDLVDAELANLRSAKERIEAIDAQLEPLIEFQERAASAKAFDGRISAAKQPAAREAEQHDGGIVNLGRAFVESDQFRGYGGHGKSGFVATDMSMGQFRDTILTTGTQGGRYLPKTGRTWQDVASGTPLPLLDLLTPEPTDVAAGEIVVIGEASGANVVNEGADKPEVDWTESIAPWALETVAGWKKFSRQQLADSAGFESLVNGKLLQALRKKLHANAVAALTGAFTSGNTTTGAAGVQLYKLIRTAVATLQDRDVYPNLVALNPADHAAIDIDMLGLTLQGPVVNSGYWNLQVVALSGVTAGTAIVGDINEALTWKQKGAVDVFITDSDISGSGATAKSDFRANTLTALAETRAKFIVSDPSQLQKVVFTPSGS